MEPGFYRSTEKKMNCCGVHSVVGRKKIPLAETKLLLQTQKTF